MKILILFIFSTMLYANVCDGSNDSKFLYQNGIDIDVNISTNLNGFPIFSVTRKLDGKILREAFSNERYFEDRSGGGLTVTYDIIEKCGGVDIIYTLENTSIDSMPLPIFRVDGIKYSTNGNMYLLNQTHYGNMVERTIKDFPIFEPHYPKSAYTPTSIIHDSDFAVGMSLKYPLLEYLCQINMNHYYDSIGTQAGSFRNRIGNTLKESNGKDEQLVPPSETWNFTLSIRFSKQRNWLFTLHPYKDYFDSLYANGSSIVPKDRRPIASIVFSGSTNLLRGYYWEAIYTEGLGSIIPIKINQVNAMGAKRALLWSFAGCYDSSKHNTPYWETNYPPQFMSSLLPKIEETIDTLKQFERNGIDLGLWWGRATQVPKPIEWDPPELESFSMYNANHVSFMKNELALAVERGAKMVGLDAYFDLPLPERYYWLDTLERLAPNVTFIAESHPPCDIIHSRVPIFLWSTRFAIDTAVTQAPLLQQYINPDAEIWLYLLKSTDALWTDKEHVQALINMGYTPLLELSLGTDLSNLNYDLYECFDGVDNDNDGLIDFPADTNCLSATGKTEGLAARVMENENLKNNFIFIFPNPFNPTLNISYNGKVSEKIQFSIYNMNGRLVHFVESKNSSISWNASKFASGSYLIKITDGSKVYSKKAIYLK